jgi:hypothetical protein
MTSERAALLRERAALVLLALLVRLVVVAVLQPEPVWDGRYFDALARHLADGDGYVVAAEGADGGLRPTAHYPIGFPALLAAAYRIFGDRVGVAFALQAMLGASLVAVVHTMVSRAGSSRAARLAALLVALHPGLVLQAPIVMAEPLAAVLYAGAIACILHDGVALASSRALALAGLCLGYGTLARPQTLLLVPAFGAVLVFDVALRRRRARAVLALAPVVLVAAAVVLPWSLRNARVLDGPALVSTNGGWNLAIGTLPGATGRYRGLPPNHGCEAEIGEVHVDRCLAQKGREAIVREPLRVAALAPAKVSYAVDYEAFPIEALHEARPELIGETLRKTSWRVLMVLHQALLLGAAARVLRSRSRRVQIAAALVAIVPMVALARPTSAGIAVALAGALLTEADRLSRLVGATLAVFLGTHAVFFGEDRYHIVVEALFAVVLAVRVFPRSDAPVDVRA